MATTQNTNIPFRPRASAAGRVRTRGGHPAKLTGATAAEIERVLGPGAGQPVYIIGGAGGENHPVWKR